jgi:hypothetical protein
MVMRSTRVSAITRCGRDRWSETRAAAPLETPTNSNPFALNSAVESFNAPSVISSTRPVVRSAPDKDLDLFVDDMINPMS